MRPIGTLLLSISLAALLGSSACSRSSDPPAPGRETGGLLNQGGNHNAAGSGGNVNDMTGGARANTGGAQTGAGGMLGDFPVPNCAKPADLGVRLIGRYDGCTSGGVRMAWSGTGFIARFKGTGLRVTQSGEPVQYTVLVDGVIMPVLKTQSGEQTYEVVSGLASGEHIVEVYRRGEASFGTTTLLAIDAIGGALLEPPTPLNRRIEVFGDSITCGYGNEGEKASCPFSADTQNHYLSYAAILARRFDSELSTVAWSGKGVVINYGGDTGITLPQMIDRAIPESDASVWDYSLKPAPQVVMINLGTNDFSTDNDPSDEEFFDKYLILLRTIRARYPGAFILATVGPLLAEPDKTKAESGIIAAIKTLNDEGDNAAFAYKMQSGNANPGCDWHPGLATHKAMAEELGAVLVDKLGW